MAFPRIVIAALRGGSGKTILSVGIIAAWTKLGKSVAPYKKGPDYIDAGWLAMAAGRPCYNLDTFLITKEQVLKSFLSHALENDIAVIEGNRGLYDGIDSEGSTSTAELAKLLNAPVILCIDCTKTTRTMAAVVSGCIQFDPDVNIKGVVLNRVAGSRHESVLRRSIEQYCGISVLGAVPKMSKQNFPERHMGLIPTPEHEWGKDSIAEMAKVAEKFLDLDSLAKIAFDAAAKKTEDGGRKAEGGRQTADDGAALRIPGCPGVAGQSGQDADRRAEAVLVRGGIDAAVDQGCLVGLEGGPQFFLEVLGCAYRHASQAERGGDCGEVDGVEIQAVLGKAPGFLAGFDGPEGLIVYDDERYRDVGTGQGFQLSQAHQQAAVPAYADHGRVGLRQPGAQDGGQHQAHGASAGGTPVRARSVHGPEVFEHTDEDARFGKQQTLLGHVRLGDLDDVLSSQTGLTGPREVPQDLPARGLDLLLGESGLPEGEQVL